ncbi:MAG: hypothetical protein JSS46_09005 [Proteobacteria bacterium]|jgi:hypothetical protein|nr:hypothetical protein [Pseudomonadota bacterium]
MEAIMNRIEPVPFAFANVLTFLVLYLACAAAVVLFPDGTVNFFNSWFHGLDLNLLRPPGGRPLTLAQLVTGAIGVVVVAFPAGLVLAALYNTFNHGGKHAASVRPRTM